MKRTKTLLLIATVFLAATAGAQNLLTNGTFDSDVSGWEYVSDRASWRGDMGNTLTGGSGPGSIEIRQDGDDCNGGTAMITQRVQVTPGKIMQMRVAAYIPGGGNEAMGVYGVVYWEDSSYNIIAYSEITAPSMGNDTWLWMEAKARVPEGTAYASFSFGTTTPPDPCTTGAWAVFDDAWFAPVAPELFVPAAAAASGANGTYWSTTLWAINPNDVEIRLDGAFLPAGQDNSAAPGSLQVVATIPARGATEVLDVVSVLGFSGAGGLFLRAVDPATGDTPPEAVEVVTYTFTPSPAGGGNYGQGIPAEESGEQASVRCPGVRQDDSYRTNVGVLNTSPEEITVKIDVHASDGTVVGSGSWTLPPYSQKQVGVSSLGVSNLATGYVAVTRTSGSGGFLAYISRVDNATGDAVYVPGR